jgi:opacity protein-like surface antigen
MRSLVLAAVVSGVVSAAHAADLPDLPVLRGGLTEGLSNSAVNWDGYYVGGQAGYESADMDFSRAALSLTNFIFRNSVLQEPTSSWSVLNKQHVQGSSFGAFVGRNWQFEDTVWGLELNYNYMNRMVGSSASSLSLAIVNPAGDNPPTNHSHSYDTTVSASAALKIKDVVTLRGRAGWAADNFMPYAFGGLAVGRMEVSRSATTSVYLTDTVTDPNTGLVLGSTTSFLPSVSTTNGEQRTNSFVAGWTGGLGFEYMIWGGLFARGEWEYTKFVSVKDISVSLNSFRAGLGYKF